MGAYLLWLDSTGDQTSLLFDVVTDESWNGTNQITEHPVETGANVADNVRVGLSKCQLTVFVTNEPFKNTSFTDVGPQSVTITIAAPDQPPFNPVQTLTAKQWRNGLALRTALQGVGALAGKALGGATGGFVGDIAGGALGALINPPHTVDVPFVPGVGMDQTPGQSVGVSLVQVKTPDDYVRKMYEALETLRTTAQLLTVVGSKNYKQNMVIESVDMDRSADTGTGAEFTLALKEIRFVTTQTVNAPVPTIPRAKTPVAKGPQNPVPVTPPKRQSVLAKLETLLAATPQAGVPVSLPEAP